MNRTANAKNGTTPSQLVASPRQGETGRASGASRPSTERGELLTCRARYLTSAPTVESQPLVMASLAAEICARVGNTALAYRAAEGSLAARSAGILLLAARSL